MSDRISWDEYFMEIAKTVAVRSSCNRRKIGSVAVKDNRIISTGYNGASIGVDDCTVLGCLKDELGLLSGTSHEVCRAIHAEQNVIIQAATTGVSMIGATVYITHSPCIICAKMLVNCKVSRVVYDNEYSETSFKQLFEMHGIQYKKL